MRLKNILSIGTFSLIALTGGVNVYFNNRAINIENERHSELYTSIRDYFILEDMKSQAESVRKKREIVRKQNSLKNNNPSDFEALRRANYFYQAGLTMGGVFSLAGAFFATTYILSSNRYKVEE